MVQVVERCPECDDSTMFLNIAMNPGGPDSLLAVCTTCGCVVDLGPIDHAPIPKAPASSSPAQIAR